MSESISLDLSPLQKLRLLYVPLVVSELVDISTISLVDTDAVDVDSAIAPLFPHLKNGKLLRLSKTGVAGVSNAGSLKVGVVLSGGQAPGGHNVIAGIFDALKQFHPQSTLIGFLQGPGGIVKNEYREITAEYLSSFRNQGGFDCIGSGRTKIESPEQFEKALKTVVSHGLDGLVIIGGDDSNTNAAFLAEYFLAHGCKTAVVGVPKTIDGDLKNEQIELSFGFDTACRAYCEAIGNIARDAISAKKYYYFIKLMGRSASHITLECALQTHPNLALIAEEAKERGWGLQDVVGQIVTLVKERKELGKEYGLILIPEGIIEFLPDMRALISELNTLLAPGSDHVRQLEMVSIAYEKVEYICRALTPDSCRTMKLLPQEIQLQLLLDRDPHGNVQVSKIETERLFISLVSEALKKEKVPFAAQPIFYGYEGRSCLPTNFDASYCYNLGLLAALTLKEKKTGYIVSFTGLGQDAAKWQPKVSPLLAMLHEEIREGKKKAVIEKALVLLNARPFILFDSLRASWRLTDCYRQVGPTQFFGPKEVTDQVPLTL